MPAKPRTLSHVVLFVADMDAAVGFYRDRPGFRITDTLTGAGPFLRPQANADHHRHFFIRTPAYMQGCEHLAFHLGGPTELRLTGSRMIRAEYESFWEPGRHKFGSNWFWYFKSPLGCNVEFDADMDTHDDDWAPREAPMGPERRRRSCSSIATNGRGAGRAQALMLCRLSDLPDGGARSFEVPGLRCKVIVVRRGGQVFGWRDLCPHYAGGTPMAWKRDAYLNGAGTHIACHAQGAWFDIESGACVQGPCLGKRLTRVPLTLDEGGAVRLARGRDG